MTHIAYSLPAAIFFAVFSAFLLWSGGLLVQTITLVGLLAGALSQFLAQDPARSTRDVGQLFAYLGFSAALMGLVTFVVTA